MSNKSLNNIYIYSMPKISTKIFKIGMSKKQPSKRIKEQVNFLPKDLIGEVKINHLFLNVNCTDADIHKFLKTSDKVKRISREWFECDNENVLIEEINSFFKCEEDVENIEYNKGKRRFKYKKHLTKKIIGSNFDLRMMDKFKEELDFLKSKNKSSFLINLKGNRGVGKKFFISNFVNEEKGVVCLLNLKGVRNKNSIQNFKNATSELFNQINFNIDLMKEDKDKVLNLIKNAKNWNDLFLSIDFLLKIINENYSYIKMVMFLEDFEDFSRKDNFEKTLQTYFHSFLSKRKNFYCFVENMKSENSDLIIELKPYGLMEIRDILRERSNNKITNEDVVNYYCVFGGIIKYYRLIDFNKTFEENITYLLSKNVNAFKVEERNLFDNLFSKERYHKELIKVFCQKKKIKTNDLNDIFVGKNIYPDLKELEQNGVIKSYKEENEKESTYCLNSNFVYFYYYWIENEKKFLVDNSDYDNWKGTAFEILLFNRIEEILGLTVNDETELHPSTKINKYLNMRFDYNNSYKQIDLLLNYIENQYILIEAKSHKNEYVIGVDENKDLSEKFISLPKTFKKIKVITINGARFARGVDNRDVEFICLSDFLKNK